MAAVTMQGNALDEQAAGDSVLIAKGDLKAGQLGDEVSVRLVELEATFALRKAVLRPWLTQEMCHDMYGGEGEHFNVGAFVSGSSSSARGDDGGGDTVHEKLLSTAGFVREPHPGEHADAFGPRDAQWRLRGMATVSELQGRGIGGTVLEFGVREVAKRLHADGHATGTVWCNGRTSASSFYERHDFAPVGELFHTPMTGPHYVYWRQVVAADT